MKSVVEIDSLDSILTIHRLKNTGTLQNGSIVIYENEHQSLSHFVKSNKFILIEFSKEGAHIERLYGVSFNELKKYFESI